MQFKIEGTTLLAYDEDHQEPKVVIPDGVTVIAHSVFAGCNEVKEIIIPDSVQKIEFSAFRNSGLTSIVIPDSVTELGSGAFSECWRLTHAVIGRGITRLKDCTFETCQYLEHLELPEGLEHIDYHALVECYSLKTIWVNGREYRIRDPEAPKPVRLVFEHLEEIRDDIRAYYESGAMDEFEYIDYQIAGDGYDY